MVDNEQLQLFMVRLKHRCAILQIVADVLSNDYLLGEIKNLQHMVHTFDKQVFSNESKVAHSEEQAGVMESSRVNETHAERMGG